MLSAKAEEYLAEKVVERIEEANTLILNKIGESIKKISTLSATQVYQLAQMLKYGGSYEEIAKELAKISGKSVQEIYQIFEMVASDNKYFAKEFYEHRGMDFIPYRKDGELRKQVLGLAKITANSFMNYSNTTTIGYIFTDLDGSKTFKNIEQAYQEVIDRAVLSMAQGKTAFQEEMTRTIKELGQGGIVQYESGRTRRLDSAVRQNMLGAIRDLNITLSRQFGQEFGADGVEISVHINPAEDHEDVQGRQFTNEQYELLQDIGEAVDIKEKHYDIHNGKGFRPIGTLNCRHRPLNIILGVSQPQYTDEQLDKIKEDNHKGFDFEGNHYTMYEGTQLQRKLETEIRKAKDTQILARASGEEFKQLAEDSQSKINLLTGKYTDLCKASGLTPKKERMSVSGYRKIKTNIEIKEPVKKEKTFNEIMDSLKSKNVTISDGIINLQDKELRNRNLLQLDKLTDKYNHDKITRRDLLIETFRDEDAGAGVSYYGAHKINLNTSIYNRREDLLRYEERNQNGKYHFHVDEKDRDIYSITHEYGHIVEYEYFKKEFLKRNIVPITATKKQRMMIDSELRTTLVERAIAKLDKKITKTEFKDTYFSRYSKMKNNFEWFAEAFVKAELTNDNDVWAQVMREWLKENARR